MTPVPVGVQKLAAQLARRMPWLARGRHIGALARLLHRHQLNADAGWSAERMLWVLEQHNRTTGHLVPDPATQRNPLGYLHARLTAATDHLTPPPTTPPVPSVPAWRVEGEERRRQIAAEDPAVIAAVIADIRADIAADRTRTTAANTDSTLSIPNEYARSGASGRSRRVERVQG